MRLGSKRAQRRRKCGNKIPYSTREEAIAAAIDSRKKTPGLIVDAYKCSYGDHWHRGRRPKSVDRIINKRREK